MTSPLIPISKLVVDADVEASVLDVLRSGQLAQGPKVEQLEAAFCSITGARHAVAVANGTVALEAAMHACGVGPGWSVAIPAFTFVATLNAALRTGADVHVIDIDETGCLDAAAVADWAERATRSGSRVAVVPVHLYGQMADMAALRAAVAGHEAVIIEDAAQALGATSEAGSAGACGLAGCFSMYATKNVAAGEGGVVTTNDPGIADRLRLLRNQGMRARYDYQLVGDNWRLTDLAAAVALPQLVGYDKQREQRRKNAATLNSGLSGLRGMILPSQEGGVWHQYTIRVTGDAPMTRERLMTELAAAGVGCGVYYPRPVHDYPVFREHRRVHVENDRVAATWAQEVLSLPVHQHLTALELDRIVAAVRKCWD